MTEDDDILAAEFALGLLDDAEAAQVQVRARSDAALSLRIAWWRDQLAPLVREVETTAPEGVWPRIVAQLPVNDNPVSATPWKWATAATGALAAVLLVMLASRPSGVPVGPVTRAAPMVAALSGKTGAVIAATYDATSGTLTIAPDVLDPGTGDAEFWIIPQGGVPKSLGVFNAKAVTHRQLDPVARNVVTPGATFAITQEVKGGSPTGAPGGPIVATGKIIRT